MGYLVTLVWGPDARPLVATLAQFQDPGMSHFHGGRHGVPGRGLPSE